MSTDDTRPEAGRDERPDDDATAVLPQVDETPDESTESPEDPTVVLQDASDDPTVVLPETPEDPTVVLPATDVDAPADLDEPEDPTVVFPSSPETDVAEDDAPATRPAPVVEPVLASLGAEPTAPTTPLGPPPGTPVQPSPDPVLTDARPAVAPVPEAPAARPRQRLRVSTVVWGLVIATIGVGILAWASGFSIDLQLSVIVLLAAAGTALLVGSIVSGARSSRR